MEYTGKLVEVNLSSFYVGGSVSYKKKCACEVDEATKNFTFKNLKSQPPKIWNPGLYRKTTWATTRFHAPREQEKPVINEKMTFHAAQLQNEIERKKMEQ